MRYHLDGLPEMQGFSSRLFSGDDRVRKLSPLTGVDKQPVVSLSAAVDAFGDDVDDKDVLVEAALFFADDFLLMNGGADPHGCTRDEIGAINLYTMEGVYRESTRYQSDCDFATASATADGWHGV